MEERLGWGMNLVLASCCFAMRSTDDELEAVLRGPDGAARPADEALQLLHTHVPRARVARAYVREVARLCDVLSVRPVCAAAALLANEEDGVPAAAASSQRTRAYVAATNHRICQCAKLCQAIAKTCLRGPDGFNISALLLLRDTPDDSEEDDNDDEDQDEEEQRHRAVPSRVLTYLLVEVLNSPCRELRAEVARILYIVATRASAACQAVVAAELQNILIAVAWEQQWHRGVREVVVAMQQLLFPASASVSASASAPVIAAPRTAAWVLAACVLPLHHSRDAYRLCADPLTDIVVAACERGLLTPAQLAETLCRRRCFLTAPNESQVHMLAELQLVLETTADRDESDGESNGDGEKAMVVFAPALAAAVQSNSIFVCDRALAFVRAPVVLRCLVGAGVLSAVLPGIVRTSETHWDVRVRSLALVTIQHLRRTNNAKVNELLVANGSA